MPDIFGLFWIDSLLEEDTISFWNNSIRSSIMVKIVH